MSMISGRDTASRADQKKATRRLILETARQLFTERGFEATTTRAIAERAGVAAGTVFSHFPDKQALLEATLAEQIASALDTALATVPPGDLIAQWVHVAETLYASYAENPDLARALIQQSLFQGSAADSRGDAESPLDEQRRRLETWLNERLQAAEDRGERPAGGDRSLVFVTLFSLYFSVLIAGLRGEVPLSAQASLLETLLRRHFVLTETDQ